MIDFDQTAASLTSAVDRRQPDVINALINTRMIDPAMLITPFHSACALGHLDTVTAFLNTREIPPDQIKNALRSVILKAPLDVVEALVKALREIAS